MTLRNLLVVMGLALLIQPSHVAWLANWRRPDKEFLARLEPSKPVNRYDRRLLAKLQRTNK